MKVFPVILSGGVGSRLWPTSRALYPKQLLPLVSERAMLQETADRVTDSSVFAPPMIISNEEHRFIIAAQMQELGMESLVHVLEPMGRNTAPAAAVAAEIALNHDKDAVLLILPADHHIGDQAAFRSAIDEGTKLASDGRLVTFGVIPTGPETGYGYIKEGAVLEGGRGRDVAGSWRNPPQRRRRNILMRADIIGMRGSSCSGQTRS